MTREEKIERLARHCGEELCSDCVFRNTDCDFDDWGDNELDDALNKINQPTPVRENGCDNSDVAENGGTPEYESRPHLWEAQTVDHPQHYQGKNECIDVMIAMFGKEAVKHFCMCNAYKYRFRSTMKNGEEDIKKAEWYESKLIELGGVE